MVFLTCLSRSVSWLQCKTSEFHVWPEAGVELHRGEKGGSCLLKFSKYSF
jgi:hypothetical protein